jgi:hypothetical protein
MLKTGIAGKLLRGCLPLRFAVLSFGNLSKCRMPDALQKKRKNFGL